MNWKYILITTITSEECRLVVTENDLVQKQAGHISTKLMMQPVKVAMLMFNKHT
jgi:hypothetical protein